MSSHLAVRLYIPIIEGYMFDAVSGNSEEDFKSYLAELAIMMVLRACFRVSGMLLMEGFSLFSLRQFFHKLFTHLVHQDMGYFDSMSTGEVLARTGGDSLTFRSLLTTSMYRFIESITLLLGAIALIGARSGDAITSSVPLLVAIVVVQCANIVIGYIFGPYARQKNLAVRQALGRMYGFALDTFTHIRTVVSLQMEARMSRDYLFYCVDYFRRSFTLNSATKLLTGFTLWGHCSFASLHSMVARCLYFPSLKMRTGRRKKAYQLLLRNILSVICLRFINVDMLRSAAKNAIDQYARIWLHWICREGDCTPR